MQATDTAAAAKAPRRPRAKKPIEITGQGEVDAVEMDLITDRITPESPPDSQTNPDPTLQPALESPETGQGAIPEGSPVSLDVQTPEASATGLLGAMSAYIAENGIAGTVWPAHYVEAMQSWKLRVERAEAVCKSAEIEMNSLKAEHSKAKKAFDAAVMSLRTEVSREPEKLPLFDGQTKTQALAKPAPDKEDDRWKSWKLEDVEDLPGGAIDALESVNVRTLGEFTAWTSRGNRLEDLRGIGEKTADKISDTLAALHVSKPWEVATATPDEVEPDDEIVTPEEENEPEDAPGDDDDNWDDESDETDDE